MNFSCASWVGEPVDLNLNSPLPATEPNQAQIDLYSPEFFAGAAPGSLRSARRFLEILFEAYQPRSVLDVGCGQGGWLAAAEELGATRLCGVDGPWVNPAALLSKAIDFKTVNLEQDFATKERFDLCISVEVAEHLSSDRARSFVKTLCAASDVILFSAAIRLQGGVNHINEQWQSYWAGLFAAAGYECHDLFRARLWTDQGTESWYRQNVLLYVKRGHEICAALCARSLIGGPIDVVHPEIYEGNLQSLKRMIEEPTLKVCCQMMGRWTQRQLKKVFR